MNTKINEILQEIESVIVGKNEIVEKILMAILAQGHVLMEDVPGRRQDHDSHGLCKGSGLGDAPCAVHVGHRAVGHHRLLSL